MRDFFLMAMNNVVEFFEDGKDRLIVFIENAAENIVVPILKIFGFVLIVVTTPLWIVPYLFYRNHKQN